MVFSDRDTQKLFCKSVAVKIKDSNNVCRVTKLLITIEWHTTLNRQELVVKLTDENDPFFLYTLQVNEDDFQMLKINQGLIVDFTSFPQSFIKLIELCLIEENKSQPKYLLILNVNERFGINASSSQLDIVETNSFKHLTHLSLKFSAATNDHVKDYLASCFKNLKNEKFQLENKLRDIEDNLRKQLSQAQETLSAKIHELELVRKEFAAEISMKESQHANHLREECDKLINRQKEVEDRYEREKREKEHDFHRQIQQFESRIACLDSLNKEIQDKNYKQETTIRELKSRIISLEEEDRKTKDCLKNCNRKNEHLQAELEQISCLENKIHTLENDIRSKNNFIRQLKDEIDDYQIQKSKLEKELGEKCSILNECERIKQRMCHDIEQSNKIIVKLQQEINSCHEKIQYQNKISSKHEQTLEEQDKIMKIIRKDLLEYKSKLEVRDNEVKHFSDEVNSLSFKIREYEKELKTKEGVIRYLNRQLTDACLIPSYKPPANLIGSSNATENPLQINDENECNLPMASNPSGLKEARPKLPGVGNQPHLPLSINSSNISKQAKNVSKSAKGQNRSPLSGNSNQKIYQGKQISSTTRSNSASRSMNKSSRLTSNIDSSYSRSLAVNHSLAPSHHVNDHSPLSNEEEFNFEDIDSEALSAAFGSNGNSSPSDFMHSTAKKQNNSSKHKLNH